MIMSQLNFLNLQEQERRQRLERQETLRLRKEAVHKPLPIMKQAPPEIQPSDKALTLPKTPRFSVRRRRLRSE